MYRLEIAICQVDYVYRSSILNAVGYRLRLELVFHYASYVVLSGFYKRVRLRTL